MRQGTGKSSAAGRTPKFEIAGRERPAEDHQEEETLDPADVPVPDEEEEESLAVKRRWLLDDLPTQLKKTKLMDVPLGASKLSELAAFLIVTGEQSGRVGDWWMNEDDLCGVGSLLGRRVRGARVHTDIRQKLFDNERHQDRNRVSVMFEEGASQVQK